MRQTPSWHALAAMVAAIACAIGLGLAAHFQTQENAQQTQKNARLARQLQRDEQAQIDACNRQNQQTVANNKQSMALYGVLKLTLDVNELTINSGQVPQQLRSYIAPTLSTLKAGVSSTSWTPPTNCTQVIKTRGQHYQLAAPIPFAKRFPPPSALTFKRT